MPKAYHVAPTRCRAGIQRSGLVPVVGPSESYLGRRTWMSSSLENSQSRLDWYHKHIASAEPMDIWEIDLEGIAIRTDLNFSNGDLVTNDPIPPTNLTLLTNTNPKEDS